MLVDRLFDLRPERPGYRLQRLEVFNWGTFDSTDGRIYSFEPQGRTSLLVGCNGSGKSTLVDAILTLLVPSSIRNYNVAAGARKTERNEKSYIRGAYGRGDVDDASAASVKYLRPHGNHLTALLAVFRDETLDRAFTLCQVLYLKADAADQVYAIADEARGLKHDLAGLQSSEKIRTHLQRLGYRTTKAFNEYDGWIGKRTGMRGKAMDMFNQTVAVKDIHSLNEFIRKHMLESRNWREKVQPLLTHFHDLSAAHQELLRAQLAEQLLAPIETFGNDYRRRADELSAMERRLKAAETYFAVATVRLCEPELADRRSELAEAGALRNRLTEELKDLTERIRVLKNDIDIAGGQRLRDLPALIREETVRREAKEQASIRYHGLLKDCGIVERVRSAEQFAAMRKRLQADFESNGPLRERMTLQHEERLAERAGLNRHIQDEQAELRILSQRQTNLASRFTWMRGRICEDLQIAEPVLPFAAELISVAPDERRWEASIELVLRPLALSLLVPERLYARVRSYVERSRLEDDRGEGQRLVYLRVGRAPAEEAPGDRLDPLSMLRKLNFRLAHDLTPWVRAEVLRRYDYRCCDTVEQFNEVDRLAMTENRHVKFGPDRHEKDDRPRTVDPRNYVLGWDNREKRRLMAERIDQSLAALASLEQAIADERLALDAMRRREEAAASALDVSDFDAIDFDRHAAAIADLERERAELESTNEAVASLRKTLAQAEEAFSVAGQARDAALKREQSLTDQIAREEAFVDEARKLIAAARKEGAFDRHAREFAGIAESLGKPELTIEDLFVRKTRWPEETQRVMAAVREELQPITDKLLAAMTKYLREFKEERTDLDASVKTLDSFLQLLHQVRAEDLPRHEKKFKDRLNDKVSQEVALLNASLRQECKQIEEKIRQLNVALAALDFQSEANGQPATYMKLEPREVNDREIGEFRRALRECLDESLENSDAANEARFLRIKKLVERLSDKESSRWRDKVIDVRFWYDFAAREIRRDDESTRSYYEDSAGQSGGEKAKLAFTILVAAIAYQFDIDPSGMTPGRFQFVVVDEMFSKVDDRNALYALRLFQQFGLQLLIVAPLDAKARVTESFVDCYLHAVKDEATHRSELYSMTAREYDEVLRGFSVNDTPPSSRKAPAK